MSCGKVFVSEDGIRPSRSAPRLRWKNRNFFTVSSLDLMTDALVIAFANDRSLYDCLYVALAIQFEIDMITADERLANALAARLPVKWLGAFATR